MTKLVTLLAIALVSLNSFAGGKEGKGDAYKVNTTESEIIWKGKKVSGEHFGKLKFSKGLFEAHGGDLFGGRFEADMNSITCDDLGKEYGDKLVGHLKSKDFFDVENHQYASVEITNIQPEEGNQFTLEANLTIKGITSQVVFPAEIFTTSKKIVARGEMVFDRTVYDIKYGSGKFFEGLGDRMIDDEVAIKFVIVAEKDQEDHSGHNH
ncbi:YceI family protein [Luteibaculum oceani]|uniref:YceI family protein n=1 Tax=Luteibaculum oceani TaxID=1294296 RepID=A0A5C6USD2_9FLAO|nr:YceI family protein [Luteibaculum oceani]TXC75574.1 YceI family protein [Luteibaculum oceani]